MLSRILLLHFGLPWASDSQVPVGMPHFASEALRVSLKCALCPAISKPGVGHLLGASRVSCANNVPSPSQPFKGVQCLDTMDIGLVEDAGV
eukprot:g41013.t1